MHLIYFKSRGWREWDLSVEPTIPEGMPVLVDDDLLFTDGFGERSTVPMNRWLRELPASGEHPPTGRCRSRSPQAGARDPTC